MPFMVVVKALGVAFDKYMFLDGHFGRLFDNAQVRQGVLARVAQTRWVLETGELRITRSAVMTHSPIWTGSQRESPPAGSRGLYWDPGH